MFNSFPENHAVYEIMRKNMVEQTYNGWQYNTAHAHGILDNKGYTHTHTHTALQQWMHKLASLLRYAYIACIVEC